ncbi:ExbD/TolR family protein [Bordetella pseudohinzii]|uniref:Biopolymer transport protein exbD n=1 Tax=Bordetella pseudohinzii TaxID=1331258 RepID=A0A0J6C6W8_9BORD|nr:biopolymer transporter ExbD [Bordetella pseudohinzii]ANY15821.1 biopolymer transporter ExbD [Bordetella pseudohinzii]KMM25052.1 biopolymer transporter ExbD [Bordetella pseudohinzii]KXA80359.1 biopolymer transporter ExbD [Bordetella pseudohinzii]KXA81387.1 biopolymer transporter ExbD [Bordetella pseudohinzii]CUI43357.1 Biopolymer transport protein exbD [Bordetella pseudohinzii]
MNFRRRRGPQDELDINFIPLIDVLLVMLIFLAATTTFARHSQLKVTLPQAQADQAQPPATLEIAVSQDGHYALNGTLLDSGDPAAMALALRQAAEGRPDAVIVINADAQASHQSVVNVMQAAREAGIGRVNFAAQTAR